MRWTDKVMLAGSLIAAALGATTARAAIIDVPFAGTLATASNFPNINGTESTFFSVGQSFYGNVVYDDAAGPQFSDGSLTVLFIADFNIFFSGVDLSTRFIPRQITRDAAGNVEFLAGGASQGGSTSLRLFVGPPNNSYPTAQQLLGRSAAFDYSDFRPGGGVVSGTALLGAVPEPASWVVMLTGFGAIGAVLRRGRPMRAGLA